MCLVNVSDAMYFLTSMLMIIRNLNSAHPSINTVAVLNVLMSEPKEELYSTELAKHINMIIIPKTIEIMKENPAKVPIVCHVISAMIRKEKKEKIAVISRLRKSLETDAGLMYSMLCCILEESEYEEEIFDIFLYYAIVGL